MTLRPLALVSLLLAGCGYPEFAFSGTDTGAPADSGTARDTNELVDSAVEDSALVDSALVDTGTPDTALPDSAGCETGLSACGGTCVDTRTALTHCGMCGKTCATQEFCADGTCRPEASCAALKKRYPTLATGAYMIDPDGAGPLTPFRVFCELNDGDGWTLALKLDGKLRTFVYEAPLWTNDTLLNPTSTDLSPLEAKFRSFNELPVKQLRLQMVDATSHTIVINATGSSFRAIMAGPRVTTTAGRATWLTLVTAPSLQSYCNAEGINIDFTATTLGPRIRLRIGIAANQEMHCDSPDSFIGFGGSTADFSCFGGTDPAITTGNLAGAACGAPEDRITRTFGYLYVR